MSNIQRFENLKQVVALVQPKFDEMAKIHGAVNYKREASFALQILQKNEFTASVAMGNQDSLKNAIINVAAIGLSLSPIHRLAYLLPRKGEICLDISYLGYIQLAVEVGAIKWVHSELVHEKDKFRLRGLGNEPLHEFDVFGDRGKLLGAYCTAKTHDGDFITAHMTIAEIYSIRDRSESWKSGKSSPWKSDESDMIKKTVLKKGYKFWPKTDTRENRFERAIEVMNEADPIDFVALPAPTEKQNNKRQEDISKIVENLTLLDRSVEKFVVHLTTVERREIKTLEDLTENEIDRALIMLNQWLEKKNKDIKKDVVNENASAN